MGYETNTPGSDRVNDPSGLDDELLAASAGAELGRKAARRADQVRATAADNLESAASAMHSGGARVASAADSAAEALTSSADYVRDHDIRDMIDDLIDVVRNNPGPALLGAVALGFVVGRALSRH